MNLLHRISNHIAMLSPHQKERKTAQLLIEAKERLQKLESEHELLVVCDSILSESDKSQPRQRRKTSES